MRKGKKQRDPIPENFDSLEEFWAFWDTHSLADYEDLLREVKFEVDIQRRKFLVALEPDLAKAITACAQARGVSSETLINLWLREKVKETAQSK